MRRFIIPFLLSGVLLFQSTGLSAYPFLPAYDRIMEAVVRRDEKALKKMISEGININASSPSGQTALCTTLIRGDAKGYKMLFDQGATVHVPCVSQISPQTLRYFYLKNPDLGRYVDGRILVPNTMLPSRPPVSSLRLGMPFPHAGEILLAGVTVGAIALIGSGGKASASPVPEHDADLFKAVKTDLSLDDFPTLGGYWNNTSQKFVQTTDPITGDKTSAAQNFNNYAQDYYANLITENKNWATSNAVGWEYNSGMNWNYYQRVLNPGDTTPVDTIFLVNPMSYLPMVNAASAWVRGYTGYVVDRSDADNPKITQDKVKIAVMDSGLEVDTYAHTQLKKNISSTRLNYSYGPCSASNSEKCWAFSTVNQRAYLTSGTDPIINIIPTSFEGSYNMESQDKWNEYAGQFAPVCASSGGTNCLRREGSKVIYYPVGVSYNPTDTQVPAGVFYYYVSDYSALSDSSEVWNEYVSKYGIKGYVYNEKDPTPGLLNNDALWSAEDHGTHVSGIIAAVQDGVGTAGVAPNAEIIPVRVDFRMNQVMNHLKDVVEGTDAQVINLSLGHDSYISSSATVNKSVWDGFSDEVKAGYEAATQKEVAGKTGTVLVFSAGNEAQPQPSIDVVAPLIGQSNDLKENYANSIYKNLLISVVAIDENKKMAYFGTEGDKKYESNRCGSSSMYCLAAPGGTASSPIGSTSIGDSYSLMLGTSQAAPVVAASVGLLMGAFPFLKPQEVVQILFETADYIKPTSDEILAYNAAAVAVGDVENAYEKNTEEGKYNAIYGHGLVNLDAATDPVGVPKISLDTVASSALAVNASSSSVTLPASLSHVLSVLPKDIIVLDKYTRSYAMAMSNFVKTEKKTDSLKRSFRSFMAFDEKTVDTNDHLSFALTAAPSDSVGLPMGAMRMQMKPTSDLSFGLKYSQDTKSLGGSYLDRIVQNPFINMRQAWGADLVYRVQGDLSLTGAVEYGQNGFIDSDTLDRMSDKPMMSVIQTGLRYTPQKSLVFNMSFGQMQEEESLLGVHGAGAFETDGNKTKFISLNAMVMPFEKWKLSASYTYGMTEAKKGQTLMKFSRLTSDSFALAATYQPDVKSMYGIKLASPLRVRSGRVTFDLPSSRDMYEDRLYRTQYSADMKPDAREYDFSLFFTNQLLKDQLLVAGEAGMRLHPEHQKEAKPDWQTLFKLQYLY